MDPHDDVNEVYEKPQDAKKKKKKRHRGLKIFLGFVFILIVLPIAALYVCFYDGGKATTVRDSNFTAENILLNSSVDALDNVKDTKAMSLEISDDTINQILLSSYDSSIGSNGTINQFITGLSLEASDEDYTFLLDANLYGVFKTRVRLITSLSKETIENKDAYAFTIKDIKIGKINGIYKLVKNYAKDYLNDDFVNGLFSDIGISLHSDMANDRIYYFKEDVPNDISSKIGGSGDLFTNLIKTLFNPDSFEFTHNKNGIQGTIDLTKLGQNDAYIDHSKELNIDWTKYRDTLVDLMNDGYISLDYADEAYKYLIKGSSYSTYFSGSSSPLKNADLSKYDIKIADYTNYNGIYSPDGGLTKPEKDLKEQVTDQISLPKIYLENKVASITETMLNEMLSTSDIVGICYLMKRSLGNGKYKVNPMTITNMYANITEEGFKIVVEINLNGYSTYLCVNALYNGYSKDDYSFQFKLDEVYFGENEASDEFKTSILDLIADGFSSGSAFEFDKETHILTANFGNSIDSSSFKKDIEYMGEPAFTLTGKELADEGTFDIKLNPSESLQIQKTTSFPKDRIITYFDGLNGKGTSHNANILPYTSDEYRSYIINQTVKTTDASTGQEVENTYQTVVVDAKDKNYDATNPNTLPLLKNYHNTLISGGFTHSNPLTDEEGNTLTGDDAIRKDNYNLYIKSDVTSNSYIVVGVRQIEDYFQVFYSIRSYESSLTPSPAPSL